MVKVVNLRKEKYTIYGGRSGKGLKGLFGNPYIVGKDGERGECREKYRLLLISDTDEGRRIRDLIKNNIKQDDIIGCFCGPGKCHCDYIAEYVNSNYSIEAVKNLK